MLRQKDSYVLSEQTFRAMGCRSRVVVAGERTDELLEWALERLEQLESCWSRFLPDSEISRVNKATGCLTMLSKDAFTLIDHGVRAWAATSGLFDPLMLDELQRQGYDRSHLALDPPRFEPQPYLAETGRTERASYCDDIQLYPTLPAVLIPVGTMFDPGGVGKGLAADIVATELLDRGASGAMVDLGGDIRVVGDHPDGGTVWTIVVDNPLAPGEDRIRIGLSDGGVATSSQVLRRWATASGDRHHLLDPHTGQPATSPVAAAVVAAGATWWAEVVAKAALIAGFNGGEHVIREGEAVGTLFGFDGTERDIGLIAAASRA